MRYTVVNSFIQVIGTGWYGQAIATEMNLTAFNLENIQAQIDIWEDERKGLEVWLYANSGDFSHIQDFYANLELDSGNVIVKWSNDESEYLYTDCMYPFEDEFVEV